MKEAERVKKSIQRVVKMYDELQVIDKAEYRIVVAEDGTVQNFFLHIVPKNKAKLDKLFSKRLEGSEYTALEDAFHSVALILGKGYASKIRAIVDGSGHEYFKVENMERMELK